MAYRLKLEERPSRALRRIADEQIAIVERRLTQVADPVAAIHETRKTVKRLRALLRLLWPGLDRDAFKREYDRLGEFGRQLSPARDRDVLMALIGSLSKPPFNLARSEVTAIRRAANKGSGSASPDTPSVRLQGFQDTIGPALASLTRVSVEPDEIGTVFDGLEDGYRRCRRAFAQAYAEPTDEAFHDWRKDVQRHWRHSALLKWAWPEAAAARIALCRDIADQLGVDQDLGLLEQFLNSEAATPFDVDLRTKLLKMSDHRRKEIRAAVEPLGRRLLAERAGAYRRRVEVCWEAARLQKKRASRA